MKILFCHDTYYSHAPDGRVYAYGAFPYDLWQGRFLKHFDHMTIIGRKKAYEPGSEGKLDLSSGDNVRHVLLPNINTPLKRIFGAKEIENAIQSELEKVDALIIRGPVELGMIAAKIARRMALPYAVEMSGCAFDHTWYHGSKIGKIYAPIKFKRAQTMLRHADYVIYVTQHFLQGRYPTNGHSEYASNVEIDETPEDVLHRRLSKIQDHTGPVKIGLIGNFGNHLKGLGVALEALSKVKDDMDVQLKILGSGDVEKWHPMIERLDLSDHVEFSGSLPGGQPVLNWLDDLDFYIQPSFHEGLPRALIEAMSRGLPALASDAGGSDELLDPANIHRRGDINALTSRLRETLKDTAWKTQQAQRNYKLAKRYTKNELMPRREKFWSDFKNDIQDRKS